MTAPPAGKPGLVLLNGDLYDFGLNPADWAFIVAADGGARHALDRGVLPTRVIGDFDSLAPSYRAALERHRVPCDVLPVAKDLTDGEAAVDWALAQGPSSLVIAGGLGGRLDHTLGNVFLLHRLRAAGVNGWVTDGRQRVYLLADRLTVSGNVGDQLSIVPLTPRMAGVTAEGVRWRLAGATLHWGSTRPLSNELTHTRADLSVGEGLGLVIITPPHPSPHM